MFILKFVLKHAVCCLKSGLSGIGRINRELYSEEWRKSAFPSFSYTVSILLTINYYWLPFGALENIVGKGETAGNHCFLPSRRPIRSFQFVIFKYFQFKPHLHPNWIGWEYAWIFEFGWFREHSVLVMSNFSFSHNVFYPFGELAVIFIEFKIIACKLYLFGRVWNLLFGKELHNPLPVKHNPNF